MYAWRGRLGLLKPTHRGKTFAFWFQNVPDGVEIVPSYVGFKSGSKKSFDPGIARAEELAEELRDVGSTAVSISGTPPFLLKGLDFEREWGSGLEERLGIPVTTPMLPHALAAKALGVKRVAIATYYTKHLNDAIIEYFAAFGIEGYPLPGLSKDAAPGEELYSTSLLGMDDVSSIDVYRHCRAGIAALDVKVDALYLNGGGWDAAPALDYLEADLKIPTIWAIAAEMWYTYQRMGIAHAPTGFGQLLADNPDPVEHAW